MTNFLKTKGQVQGLCPEVRKGPRATRLEIRVLEEARQEKGRENVGIEI